MLRSTGIEVFTEATTGPRSAEQQTRRLISEGFDTIVACGGDGTVHDVLQGLVGSPAALGVIPLGTANSLACDLGLSRDPAKVATQLASAAVRSIAVGQIEFENKARERESRYFTVAAGIGLDAFLFYRLNAAFKKRWGMAAYCGESLRVWARGGYQPFVVDWFDTDRNKNRSEEVTQLLAVRILDFGGVLRHLAPGADLLRDDIRLVLFKTSSRARYLRFVTGRMVGRDWQDRYIEMVHASQVSCRPKDAGLGQRRQTVYAEADGEWVGRLPVTIRMLPNALNLLVPETASCLLRRRD